MRDPGCGGFVRTRRVVLVPVVAEMRGPGVVLVHAILGRTRPDRLVWQQDQQQDE